MDKTISALILSVLVGSMIFGMIGMVSAAYSSSGCQNRYWFDDTTQTCGQKQFCGMYMYYGLQTFETKGDCLAALAATSGIVNEDNSSCKNLYWIDNTNKNCEQQQFCGMFMYYGLQTFESKTLCEKAVNATPECVSDDDCPPVVCNQAPCPGFVCIDNKCKQEKTCPENSVNEDGVCKYTLSNGRKAEIKIMPDTASETAIAKLGDLGFTIELKEVGNNTKTTDDDKVVYELTGNKQGKFLGIFKIMARVSAQVDAETGDVKVIKPWWAFLASGV